jgi:hypothetical protein
MTTLDVPPSAALDESAHEFISTFMTHVATISGYGMNRIVTIARVKTLLLAAIARGGDAPSTAWSRLHHAIAELVATIDAGYDMHDAHDYLQSFIRENGDLAHE